MNKADNIKQIICNEISVNPNGADWQSIMRAVSTRYAVKDWVKEVRNPMQSLIDMDVIERTDSVFKESYVFTQTTKAIFAEMV